MAARKEKSHESTAAVELTRVQPFEADVIVARLRASGIEASSGPTSPYASFSFADGVPVLVPAGELSRARALLKENPD